MIEYTAIDFTGRETHDSPQDRVDKKISLLYDFGFLKRGRGCRSDRREDLVRTIFDSCPNQKTLDNLCHQLVRFEITLDQMIERRI